MKRVLVATAIALLILALTATAALAHGRHPKQAPDNYENGCSEGCAQVLRNRSHPQFVCALFSPVRAIQ